MKIVINNCYGHYSLSAAACAILGVESQWAFENDRDAEALVEVVEEFGEEANGRYAKLIVIEIPDEATDWEIFEYDGMEEVVYVLNGKLYHVCH